MKIFFEQPVNRGLRGVTDLVGTVTSNEERVDSLVQSNHLADSLQIIMLMTTDKCQINHRQ